MATHVFRKPAVRILAVLLFGTILAFLLMAPEFSALPKTPAGDGRYVFHQIEIGKAAILRYREFPMWNPWDCRGIPMWDHPESITASPLLLLLTPLSGGTTLWLWELMHVALGFLCMWIYARDDVGLSREGTAVASSMWAFSVAHTMQCMGAHSTFLTFYFAPILLYLWRRAEASVGAAIGLGLVFVFMLLEGATYPLPMCGLFLGLETLTRLSSPRRALRIARAGAIVIGVTVTVGAARLFPLMDQLRLFSRALSAETDSMANLGTLSAMFTLKQPIWYSRLTQPHEYTWHEYNTFVGGLGLGIAIVGACVAAWRKPATLFVAVCVFILMLGHFARFAPWSLLHAHAPLFKGMRVPSRFRLLIMLYVAIFVALAVDRVPVLVERFSPPIARCVRVGLLGLALLAVGQMFGLARQIVRLRYVDAPVAAHVEASPTFYYGGAGLAEFLDQPRQNRAWLGCRSYEWKSSADAPVWQGPLPQARLVQGTGVVGEVRRTNNTFAADVTAETPVRIVFNGAHEVSWTSNVGHVVADNQLLAVELPAGHHVVRMRYWPRTMTLGLVLSTLGCLAIAAYAFRRRLVRVLRLVRGRRS